MKTVQAPDTAAALMETVHAAAQNNPIAVWIIAVVLTAAFASWACRWI